MIQLVRPTEAMKEQAIEFRQEFFEHGEFVINRSELSVGIAILVQGIRQSRKLPGGKNDRIKKRKRKAHIPSGGMG